MIALEKQSYLYVNKDIFKFKANDYISWDKFVQEANQKTLQEMTRANGTLKGTVQDFLVDYSSIKKDDVLSIHQHLMAKNNTK